MPIALDTTVVIAACSAWHDGHSVCNDLLAATGEDLIVPVHALAESFSVMTRLPPPYRLSVNQSWRLLEERFVSPARTVGVELGDLETAVAACRASGTPGGRVYDALIAAAAVRAGATELWTLNPKHFWAVSPRGLTIVRPGAPPA